MIEAGIYQHILLKTVRLLEYLCSDNGPEFISEPFKELLTKIGIKSIDIYPVSVWTKCHNERINGTLRREVINAE